MESSRGSSQPPLVSAAPATPIRTIAVVLPSGRPPPGALEAGVAWLRARGLVVVTPEALPPPPDAQAFLAGEDEARAAALLAALDAEGVDAVWCGRGGTGALRTLAALDALAAADGLGVAPRRPLLGLSDATPLLTARAQGRPAGLAVHAPVIVQLPRIDPASERALLAWLEAPEELPALVGTPRSVAAPSPAAVEGPLLAGNLAMLAATCGTPEQPRMDGAILLVEDIGEPAWRVDRFMAQLARAGALDGLAALALGTFEDCTPPGGVEAVLAQWAEQLGVPCVVGFPVGHGAACWPVALGLRTRLDVAAGRLEPLERCSAWLARQAP